MSKISTIKVAYRSEMARNAIESEFRQRWHGRFWHNVGTTSAWSPLAQLRWHNYVDTTTLAQRRHGRRRHNYVGTTSAWSPSAQLHLVNVDPMLENCVGLMFFCQPYANDVGPV